MQPLIPGENAVQWFLANYILWLQNPHCMKLLYIGSWYTNSRRNPLYESTHYTDFRFPQIKAHLWHKVRVFSLFTYILERTKRSFT